MRPLLLNTYDLRGGAAQAAWRLHQGLRRIGVESRLLVQWRRREEADVLGASGWLGRFRSKLRTRLDALPLRGYPDRRPGLFTPARARDRDLRRQVRRLRPDPLHLHWVAHGFMRLESLGQLPRPVVWTLHDSWAFTGGCHVPGECTRYRERCGACPALGSAREDDLSRRVWLRKQRGWEGAEVVFVTPSRWLAGCLRASALLHAARCEVIPNGLDLESFRPVERRAARERCGLPREGKLALFAALDAESDPNKGLDLLREALMRLAAAGRARDLRLAALGARREEPVGPIEVQAVPEVADDAALAALYAAADLFVLPSRLENLPYTVMEAMACGTPCVAFAAGGTPELIEHRRTGYLARPHDAADLAEGIAWTLEDEARARALAVEGRRKVERDYELTGIARRYAELYRELTGPASPPSTPRRPGRTPP